MKKVYLIGGTMGVGKTTICQKLKKQLHNSVFLDGDWCWDANPFQVTEETKAMVLDNICHLLNSYIHCSAYEHIIFCWVMHEQSIIDSIIEKIDTEKCNVKVISLICDEETLRKRLEIDVYRGIRTVDVIERSLARIPLYDSLESIKIDTTDKNAKKVVKEILKSTIDCEIREMESSDYTLLNDFLYEAIFVPEGEQAPPKSIINIPELQVYVSDFGSQQYDRALIAEIDGKAIGAVWVRIMNDYGHINDKTPSMAISLYKEYRGLGIGTAMIQKMLSVLKADGYQQVSLSVQKNNYAVKIYQKTGFEIYDEKEEEYIMTCRLV